MSRKKRKTSKKTGRRRKHKSRESSPGAGGPLPDRRVMEGAMRQFLRDSGMIEDEDDALAEAQDLVYQAYDSEDVVERMDLASQAIEICPECADAHVCLAELAPSAADAVEMYRLGVQAGEVALGGPEAFDEYEGHFWGVLETRPYMRARLGLATCLWALAERDEAIDHCTDLLRLNPNDNQGVRYVLASFYCDIGSDDELEKLLDEYEGDGSAEWRFSRALLAFRQEGDCERSQNLLCTAHDANPHVAQYLLGHRQLPDGMPDYVQRGDETEAVSYAAGFLPGWRATSGAVSWLRRTLQIAPPENAELRRPSWQFIKGSVVELPLIEGEVWQVDMRRTAIGMPPGEDTEQPWTFVVTSPAEDEVIALETPEDDTKPTPNQVLVDLLQIMRDPQDGEPRRPERIQVRLKTYLNTWKAKLDQIGIECELCESLDHADYVTEVMESMGRTPRPSSGELESRVSELANLPQNVGEVWQADIRKLSVWITESGEPQRPWSVLVTNRTEDLIIAQDLTMDEPNAGSLWHGVLAAILSPLAGEPHVPGVIEVASEDYHDALVPLLEPLGINCVVSDRLDQLDFIFSEMERSLSGPEQGPAMIDTPGVTPKHVGSFFHAAAEYYRKTPWRNVPGDVPIKVHCDKFDTGTWYAVVMGQSGMTLGLALYEDLAVLQSLLCEDPDANRRNSGLSVMYGEAFEISLRDLDAAEENGWPVAGPEAYPMILRVNPGMAVRPPLAWELELVEGCLRAIPAFLIRSERGPARMTVPVATGELDLELSWLE